VRYGLDDQSRGHRRLPPLRRAYRRKARSHQTSRLMQEKDRRDYR
jgi:hypothetical protein